MRDSFQVVQELIKLKAIKVELHKQEREITRQAEELSKPILSDKKQIKVLYEWFENLREEEKLTGSRSVHNRQFLFVVILLFSPSTLAGEKLRPGIRNELAEVFKCKSPSSISNLCSDVLLWYQSYEGFRKSTDALYSKLIDKIELKNDLN